MIFRFTEEEQAIIRNFEKRTREEHPNIAEVFENVIEDVKEEADGEELKVKLIENPENKQIADNLRNEFNALIAQMEQKRFEVLKTQSQILDEAINTINEAIIFTYNYLNLPKWNNDSTNGQIVINNFSYTAYNYCNYLFRHGSQALFDCSIEKDLKNISVLIDGKELKEFLIEGALKNYIEKLEEDPSNLKQLYSILDEIIAKSKCISSATRYQKKELVLNSNYEVAMANSLIENGINKLSATELKILRLAIMQSKKGDTELYEYEVSAQELSSFLNIDIKHLYKKLDTMTDNIIKSPVNIKDPVTQKFHKQAWVDNCSYDNGLLTIKLAEGLKPYILGLKKCFSKIRIEEYVGYKSKHTIIIRELLEAKMGAKKPVGNDITEISIPLKELKRITNTEKDYRNVSEFRSRVLNTAIKEINDYYLGYHVTAKPYKNGRTIEGFDFIIESQAHYDYFSKQSENLISVVPGKKRKPKTKEKIQAQQLTLKDIYDQEF